MNCHTPFLSVITFILSYFIFFNTELNFALFSLTFFMKEWSHYSLPSCLFVLPVGGGSEIYFTCLCSGKRESRSTLVRKAPLSLFHDEHLLMWWFEEKDAAKIFVCTKHSQQCLSACYLLCLEYYWVRNSLLSIIVVYLFLLPKCMLLLLHCLWTEICIIIKSIEEEILLWLKTTG